MKNLRDVDVRGKRVLVRCDFNVPIFEDGKSDDDFRIKITIPTIEYLHNSGAKVVLMSHFGDAGRDMAYSLAPMAKKLSEYLNMEVRFSPEAIGPEAEKMVSEMQEGEVILLENVRFYEGEKKNDPVFARQLANLGDIFVQDGFGVCHRAHASVVAIAEILPAYPGFLVEKELKVLSKAMDNPERPFVAITGGVKISSKMKLIEKLLQKADHVLVGGKIANTILIVKGICVRDKWSEEENKLKEVADKIDLTSQKLHLPVDGVIALSGLNEEYSRIGAVGTLRNEEDIFDIGPMTVENFKDVIKEAKTIIWNGPLGFAEKEEFRKGTMEIIKAVAGAEAYTIVGGGETVEIIRQEKMEGSFDHVSSGGGAMLNFISGEELPGIRVLENN
ncbi:MAG: phosphoglycerate kinase [Candidatus Paceibacterota bacterium]